MLYSHLYPGKETLHVKISNHQIVFIVILLQRRHNKARVFPKFFLGIEADNVEFYLGPVLLENSKD